jgi:ADP-heptose:LPS heptosyltransferase
MTTPAEHAATILRWFAKRPLAQVEDDLAHLPPHHALLNAVAAIADAADSDDEPTRAAGLSALFAGLVEPLNDGFTPAGRAVYARLFTHLAWRVVSRERTLHRALETFGIVNEESLLRRYRRLRLGLTELPQDPPRKVMVLSRVTIGADVLLTSVALQRLHERWPDAELVLLGEAKLAGLFGGLPRLRVHPLTYARRGPLRERLASWLEVVEAVDEEAPALVLSPDSRLDQLGLLPVIADPHRYLLWENLQPEHQPPRSLADLLDDWLRATLWDDGQPAPVPRCTPRVAFDPATAACQQRLAAACGRAPLAAVKLDHGGNPAKALPRQAEIAVLRRARELGWRVLLDRGFGPDELANSDALLAELGWKPCDLDDSGKGLGLPVADLAPDQLAAEPVIRFHGSIAGWAAGLACCSLAFSYDSVGHHLAAALGVPVVVAFTGHSDPAFPIAWQPRGTAPVTVVEIPTARKEQAEEWQKVLAALPSAGGD